MAKQVVFNEEARRSLKRGVDIVADAVKTTLGPRGRNVAIDKKFGSPTVTHDGVTVAKEIELKDPYENMGARLFVEAATKTDDVAGRCPGSESPVLPFTVVETDEITNHAQGGVFYIGAQCVVGQVDRHVLIVVHSKVVGVVCRWSSTTCHEAIVVR